MKRRTLATLAAAAIALVSGVFIAAWLVVDRLASEPSIKPRIEKAASEFLGRPLTIGAVEWKRWPEATLIGSDVRLYEDQERTTVMIEAPRAEARLRLLSLAKLAAGVTELKFVSPVVRLRRGKDGVWNVQRVVQEIASRPASPRRAIGVLAFNWFSVEGGTLTVQDALGTFGRVPPVLFQGRGKLKAGTRGVGFPFRVSGRETGAAEGGLALSGRLGRRKRLVADVTDATPALLAPFWPPAARWTGRWSAQARWAGKDRDWSLDLRAAPLALSSAAAVSELSVLAVRTPPRLSFDVIVRGAGTDLRARGTRDERALNAAVDSRRADLAEISAWARAAAPPSRRAPPAASTAAARGGAPAPARGRPAPRMKADLRLGRAFWGPLELDGLRATVRRSTGPYAIEDLSFNALGGTVTARGRYDPGGGDAALKVEWRAASIDMKALSDLARSDQTAAGDADSTGSLTTGVGPRFLPAMTGEATADLRNGWFGQPRGILKVLTHLNVLSVATVLSPRKRRRVPFDEAHASVRVEHGRAVTQKPVVLQNKTLQFVFMGSYDLPSRTVDGRVVVHFLTVTDELIRLIPGVRDVLLGKEKGMGTIWLSVKGKADDPDVKVLPAKTIAAPVWNALRRVLRFFGVKTKP